MAFMTCKHELIFKLVLAFAIFHMAIAGDADIISDFIVPPNVTNVDGNFFRQFPHFFLCHKFYEIISNLDMKFFPWFVDSFFV